eukprot:COSAG02_NODE_1708_length_11229_cov_14.784097_2_plen_101_part_00
MLGVVCARVRAPLLRACIEALNVEARCTVKCQIIIPFGTAVNIYIPDQSLSKGYGIYIYLSDSVGLSTESQYYYDKYIYFQVPKGFQRVVYIYIFGFQRV